MPALAISLLLAAAMFGAIWMILGRRSKASSSRLPGRLSVAERRHLYKRLGIDPVALARQRRSNTLWLDPRVDDRRTDA